MPERDADSPARDADDDVSRAVRRFVRSTLAPSSDASPVDAETWTNMFTVALAGVRRACVDAFDAGVDEMTIAAREAGTCWTQRERASERELAASTRALTTARREIERLNERLGREMIRRGAEAEEGGGTDARAAAEATLYREACRKYRRRAEHYEALYRKMTTTGGGTTTTRGTGSGRTRDRSRGGGTATATRGAEGDGGDAATRRRRLEIFRDDDADERRGRETLARCAAREEKEAPPARRRRVDIVEARNDGFRRAKRREGARDDGVEYEDALWGAARTRKRRNDDENDGENGGDARARRWSAQGDSERPRARENVAAAANDAAPRRRAGEAPPLDRIFLDSKNAPSSSPSRERGANAVRKNKRLSDNAPRSPNAVFDDAENARRRPTKYQDVVRKKSERELLDAYVCQDCQTFYDAMMPGKDRSTIKCTHAPPRENVIENSRHRAKWAPEPAPKGFWNLAFTPEK